MIRRRWNHILRLGLSPPLVPASHLSLLNADQHDPERKLREQRWELMFPHVERWKLMFPHVISNNHVYLV